MIFADKANTGKQNRAYKVLYKNTAHVNGNYHILRPKCVGIAILFDHVQRLKVKSRHSAYNTGQNKSRRHDKNGQRRVLFLRFGLRFLFANKFFQNRRFGFGGSLGFRLGNSFGNSFANCRFRCRLNRCFGFTNRRSLFLFGAFKNFFSTFYAERSILGKLFAAIYTEHISFSFVFS